jgi:S-adenosylmethionine decarboxylase proenzyme
LKTPAEASLTNLGRHLLAEFYDCNPNVLNNLELIEEAMTQAATECGATVVTKDFHHFSPYGISGVVIIMESHLAIHTWPEFGYAAVDLFTCGESCDPEVAYNYLRNAFSANAAFFSELKRGLMDESTQKMVKIPFQINTEKAHPVFQANATTMVRSLSTVGDYGGDD